MAVLGVHLTRPILYRGNVVRNYRLFIFCFTLMIYACFHISRKSISIVKSVLHQNCTQWAQERGEIITQSNETICDWAPFDGNNWSQLLGSLDSIYLFVYAVGMIISGHIAERVHITYFLSIGMLLVGLTSSMFGAARYFDIHAYWYFVLSQILAGLCQTTGWPSVVACMGNWFGKSKRGFIMGFWNMHTSIGNILGSLVAGWFVEKNWGLSFIVPGLIAACVGVLVFFLLTPYPHEVNPALNVSHDRVERLQSLGSTSALYGNEDGISRQATSIIHDCEEDFVSVDFQERSHLLTSADGSRYSLNSSHSNNGKAISILGALAIPGVVEYSLCLFFAKLVSYTFLFWLPRYIKEAGNFDPSQAADLSTMFDVGGIIGGILAGLLSDFTGASALSCTIMLLLAVPSLYVYYAFGATSVSMTIVLLIVMGVFVNGPYSLITTAVSADLGTDSSLSSSTKAVATVTAIIDSTGSLGSALGPMLCGLLLPYGWFYIYLMLMVATLLAALLLSRRTIRDVIMLRNR